MVAVFVISICGAKNDRIQIVVQYCVSNVNVCVHNRSNLLFSASRGRVGRIRSFSSGCDNIVVIGYFMQQCLSPFGALTLLIGQQEGHPPSGRY